MNVKKLCCQGCGSDLVVDEGIRFVTCNYCGARLEIVHDATTTHSRLLDKIEKRTGSWHQVFFCQALRQFLHFPAAAVH